MNVNMNTDASKLNNVTVTSGKSTASDAPKKEAEVAQQPAGEGKAISPTAKPKALSTAELKKLPVAQLNKLSTKQLNKLDKTQINKLNASQLNKLNATQLKKLSASNLTKLNANQKAKLQPNQVKPEITIDKVNLSQKSKDMQASEQIIPANKSTEIKSSGQSSEPKSAEHISVKQYRQNAATKQS